MKSNDELFSEPRGARPDDRPAVVDLINRALLHPSHKSGDMDEHFPVLFADENLANCRIITAGGRPVSHVAYLVRDAVVGGPTITTALVGAVCTDEACRGRGLASRVLDDCEARMRKQGVDAAMISGGRGLYRRRGARPVGICRAFEMTGEESIPGDGALTFREGALSDRPALARLYEQQAVRFERPANDWDAWLRSTYSGLDVWPLYVALRDADITAYVLIRPSGGGDTPRGDAYEWGGRPEDVAALLAALPGLWGGRVTVKAEVGADDDLIELLEAAGPSAEPRQLSRTVKVLRPAALFENLRPHLPAPASAIEVEPADEEGARFKLGDAALALPVEDLGPLFFGDLEGEVTGRLDAAGELGAALRAALPFPLPRYGYDYT
ncbi:MAG: GNAT family N-acetyltransferase [Planctomycetota bacterium]